MGGSEPRKVQSRTRAELVFTGLILLLLLAITGAPPLRPLAVSAGFFALEIVGRAVGGPTSLLVAVYGLLVGAALVLDRIDHRLQTRARPIGWVIAVLALMGLGYTVAFAALLNGPLLALAAVTAAGGWAVGRAPSPPLVARRGPPTLAIFVLVHVLVEGTAGHILTPWLHRVSAGLSSLSMQFVPGFAGLLGCGAGLLVLLAALALRRLLALRVVGLVACASGVAMVLSPSRGPTVAALLVAAGIGFATQRSGQRLLDWAHPDPLQLAQRLGAIGLVALGCVGAHYAGTMWRCPSDPAPGLQRLATDAGAFSLAATPDGRLLVASLREAQELLVIDRTDGGGRRISLRSSSDTLFDRAEPETLLPMADGRVLVLVARSGGEHGNRLRILDPATGELSGPLPPASGQGVSDLVDDGRGGIWLSTEFEGSLFRLDPSTGTAERSLQVPHAETNKVLVDAAGGRAWSVGLWWDDQLRAIDLGRGDLTASAVVGTHQWDMAWSVENDVVLLPKFLSGRVQVRKADSLDLVRSWAAGFGVRAIEVLDEQGLAVTGSLYGGDVSGWDIASGARRFEYHVGGHVKALTAGPNGVFSAGNCGIFEVGG